MSERMGVKPETVIAWHRAGFRLFWTWKVRRGQPGRSVISREIRDLIRIRFQVLYVFLVLAHDRRRILHFNVTAHPTAEWTGQQLREAFPFAALPAAGPRCHLWQSFPRTSARHGHLRSSVCAAVNLAESLCGTSDWIDSTRVPGSCDRAPGKLVTANPQFVFRLLPSMENTSFVGERLTGATSDSAAGNGIRRSATAPRWLHHRYERRAA